MSFKRGSTVVVTYLNHPLEPNFSLCYSRVAELDAVEIEHALGVGQDESVEGQDLEHLEGRHQRAAALLDHMTDCVCVACMVGWRRCF